MVSGCRVPYLCSCHRYTAAMVTRSSMGVLCVCHCYSLPVFSTLGRIGYVIEECPVSLGLAQRPSMHAVSGIVEGTERDYIMSSVGKHTV